MLLRLIALVSTLVLVAGCALAGGRGGARPEAGNESTARPTSARTTPANDPAGPTAKTLPTTLAADASSSPAPIDDFDADMAAALNYLVATWGGSPSDYTLLVSTFATVPRSGEKLWAAKFMDEPAEQIHEVYRNSSGEVGGLELWKEAFDPPLPTPRQGHWGPPLPGTPYSGAEILNLLNFTPVPFPQALTNATATNLIAGAIWTYDGTKYDDLSLRGSCGEHTCGVDVSGQRTDASGSDTHSLAIDLADLTLRSVTHDLGGYPAALDPKLEDVARQLVEPRVLRGMTYRGASWHLPPAFDRYTLTFAVDDTEKSPGKRVTLDFSTETVVSIEDFTF